MLDVQTEGNRTLVFLAVLGVITAQCNELLADRAATICLALAALGVLYHPLHLLA